MKGSARDGLARFGLGGRGDSVGQREGWDIYIGVSVIET